MICAGCRREMGANLVVQVEGQPMHAGCAVFDAFTRRIDMWIDGDTDLGFDYVDKDLLGAVPSVVRP